MNSTIIEEHKKILEIASSGVFDLKDLSSLINLLQERNNQILVYKMDISEESRRRCLKSINMINCKIKAFLNL